MKQAPQQLFVCWLVLNVISVSNTCAIQLDKFKVLSSEHKAQLEHGAKS
jgi:hypothetical protein